MKKFICLIVITLLSSCGETNQSDYMFNSHDEILTVFKNIMIENNLVSKSNGESRYSFTSGELDTESYKLVKIMTQNIDYHSFNRDDRHECVYYNGEFVIGSTDKGEYKCRLNLYIKKGDSLTVKNILKHNELDLSYKNDFIELSYAQGPRNGGIWIKSVLGNGLNIINGNGVLLRDNRLTEAGYLKKYIKDTIEYSKTVNGKLEGKSFVANIVYLGSNWSEGYSTIKTNFSLFNGKTIKYLESEENYVDGKRSGEQVYREQGIVTKKQIAENGNFINEIQYSGEVFPSKSDTLLESYNGTSAFINLLWSNQEKFKIDKNKKGYQSYTPLVKKIENRKGFVVDGYGLIYKRHGKFEENQFQPIKEWEGHTYGKWIPKIRSNYIQGKLEGNVIVYNRHEKELLNLIYKNGILIKGVKNEYYEDYDNGTYISRLTKTSSINNDTVTWKTFDSKGDILDEGLEKIDSDEYSREILPNSIWNEK